VPRFLPDGGRIDRLPGGQQSFGEGQPSMPGRRHRHSRWRDWRGKVGLHPGCRCSSAAPPDAEATPAPRHAAALGSEATLQVTTAGRPGGGWLGSSWKSRLRAAAPRGRAVRKTKYGRLRGSSTAQRAGKVGSRGTVSTCKRAAGNRQSRPGAPVGCLPRTLVFPYGSVSGKSPLSLPAGLK